VTGVRVSADGSAEHRRAIGQMQAAGFPVPECWRPQDGVPASGANERLWVSRDDAPTIGMMLIVSPSRRVPWSRIARVEQLGGEALASHASATASLLVEAVRTIGRVMRVHVRVFDRHERVRDALASALRAARFAPVSDAFQYTHTHVIDLSDPEDRLMGRMTPAARRAVREPLKKGLQLRTDATAADIPRMLELMSAAFDRTGSLLGEDIARHDLSLAIQWPDRRPLVTLERADVAGPMRIVAFAMGLHDGDHVTYHHGATERGGDLARLTLSYAPLWELIRWAKGRGVSWFDLGGVTASEEVSHPLSGITAFKRRFGGTDTEVATELQWIVRPFDCAIEERVGRLLQR